MLNLISIGLNHPHELAEMMLIGRSLISAELARLTAAGLIVARPGVDDRRRSVLALTPAGEDALRQTRTALAALVNEAQGHYQPAELRPCARILADMQAVR